MVSASHNKEGKGTRATEQRSGGAPSAWTGDSWLRRRCGAASWVVVGGRGTGGAALGWLATPSSMHRRCTASLNLRLPRQTLPTLSPRRISSSSSSAWPCAACPLLLLLLAPARPNTCLPARCLPANPSHHHHHHHHHPSSSSTSHAAVATLPLPHCHTATPRRRRRPALGPTGSTRPRRPTQPVPASPSQSHPPCHACPAAPAVLLLRAKRAPAARLQPHSSSPTTLHFPPAQLQTASAAASLQPPTHAHVQSPKSQVPSPKSQVPPRFGAHLPPSRRRTPTLSLSLSRLALPCFALPCPVLPLPRTPHNHSRSLSFGSARACP
jgi:hypothetical protein